MDTLTYNRKETAQLIGVSEFSVDDLDRRGELKRLTAFNAPRYGLNNILRITGNDGGKTVREKELERVIKQKDERIEELTRIIIDSRIIGRNA